MTAIEEFLKKNRKLHPEMMDVWAKDTNQDRSSLFETAKMRVLLVFLSPLATRAFSSTYTCISTLIKSAFEKESDCFIDACWYPSREFQEILAKNNIPLMFGNSSHRSWEEYDVVSISHAISPECFNVPVMYQKSKFPFSHEERFSSDAPIVLYGGAASGPVFPILSGEIPGHGHSYYDVGMIGMGEEILPYVFKKLMKYNEGGSLKTKKDPLMEDLLNDEYVVNHCVFPWLYRFEYKEDNASIKKVIRLDSRIPERVEINKIKTPIFKGFNKKLFWPNGIHSSSQDIQLSSGCSSYACSFCSEGQEAGHWTEKPITEVEQDMQEAKRYSAANTYTGFSFNSNYYGAYYDMLRMFMDNGSSISILNQRMDVIGSDQGGEYLTLAKKLGLIRCSCAVEGIGERIRNHILNKNLPRATIMRAVRNIFKQRLIMLKMGMIWTSLETKEDIDDYLSELDEILSIREEIGANSSIQLTFTPLVYYPSTPLRWQKRLVARGAWEGTRSATYLVEELRKRDVRQKWNAGGIANWVEQFILDVGWAGTPILHEYSQTYGQDYVAGFPLKQKPMFQELLDKYKIPVEFNWNGYDVDDILPNDVVWYTTPEKLAWWKDCHKKNDFHHPICLKTHANPKSRCFNCGECSSVEERKSVFGRDIQCSKNTVTDVINSLSKSKASSVTRVLVQTPTQYDFYSKEMLSHYITSLFLRSSDKLADSFYKVSANSVTWVSQFDQLDYYGGQWVFDVEWKSPISATLLKSVLSEVNSKLETCRVVNVFDSSSQLEISTKCSNIYSIQTNIPLLTLQDQFTTWNHKIKVAVKSMQGMELQEVDFSEYKDNLLMVNGKSGALIVCSLPMKYNPYLVVGSVVRKGLNWCYQNMDVTLWDTCKELDVVCSCGRPQYYSLVSDKVISECPVCRSRKILFKLTSTNRS